MGWDIGKTFRNVVRETSKFSPVAAAIYHTNPKEYQTDYQKNEKYRKATRQQQALMRQQDRDAQAKQLLESGQPTGNVLSGTEAEQKGQLAGLNLGATAYGQGLGQTGKDVQSVLQKLKARAEQGGGDPVSAAIMGQKQSAQAGARRSLAGTGARGTAMAGAIDAIGRQKDQEIAASLYGQQRQSISDLRSLLGNIVSGTTSLMQGEKAANISQPDLPKEEKGWLANLLGL
jgi:hypothetical protein